MFRQSVVKQLQKGLTAYWPLAEAGAITVKSHFAPAPVDLTNNGTAARAAGPSANLPHAAGLVRASSQYFSRADAPAVSLGSRGSFTVAGWVYLTELGGANVYTVASHYLTTGNQRSWWLRQTGSVFSLLTSVDGTATVTTTHSLTLSGGVWYFVVAYFDAVRRKQGIAVNRGTPVESAQTAVHDSTGEFDIGARAGPADIMNGRIAHLGIWRRILRTSEREWLYNAGQGRNLVRGV